MTTTAAPPGLPRGFVRRHRSTLLIGAALVFAVALAIVLGVGTQTATPMDPDNPGPDGARALARVLSHEGVDIDVARSAAELEAIDVDDRTTVVVVQPQLLGTSTIERLHDHARHADAVVVVGAGPGIADAFGAIGGGASLPLGDGRDARCDDPRFAGLSLEVDSTNVYPDGDCYTGKVGAVVSAPAEGLLLFGADQALTNDQILRADNAAVALRLLGQDQRLVWYVPSIDDLTADDGVSLTTLLPRFIQPGLWLLAVVLAVLILWRARRLGPLAVEPLPVVVRAVETTRSLGRLYRRSGDRAHAASSLRRAARARLAERLRLGSGAPPDAVVREVARRTGRRDDDVAALLGLGGDVPSTDRDLIILARQLAELDREVRRT
jgi:nucleotide-binding universal stress UspA family protein